MYELKIEFLFLINLAIQEKYNVNLVAIINSNNGQSAFHAIISSHTFRRLHIFLSIPNAF